MLDRIILDADFCIKVGRFQSIPILEEIVPLVAHKAYIHRYVYEDEILIPQSAKEQVRHLIEVGRIEVIDDTCFKKEYYSIFQATRDRLKRVMVGTIERGKNWGEVLSLACAKSLGITIFMSDESSLQEIINRQLNTGTEYDIRVFRIIDLIKWIKAHPECGIVRKTAKTIWLVAGKSKESFQSMWP